MTKEAEWVPASDGAQCGRGLEIKVETWIRQLRAAVIRAAYHSSNLVRQHLNSSTTFNLFLRYIKGIPYSL